MCYPPLKYITELCTQLENRRQTDIKIQDWISQKEKIVFQKINNLEGTTNIKNNVWKNVKLYLWSYGVWYANSC